MTGPTVEDVIGEAIAQADEWHREYVTGPCEGCKAQAAAVVAAIRAMSPEQQAQLIGGTVAHASLPERGQVPGRNSQTLAWAAKRVVGEWVSDCDDPDAGMFS